MYSQKEKIQLFFEFHTAFCVILLKKNLIMNLTAKEKENFILKISWQEKKDLTIELTAKEKDNLTVII